MSHFSALNAFFIVLLLISSPVHPAGGGDALEEEIFDVVDVAGVDLDELSGVEFQFRLSTTAKLESCLGELLKLGVQPGVVLMGDLDSTYLAVRVSSSEVWALAEIPDVLEEVSSWARFCGGSKVSWQVRLDAAQSN